MIKIILEKSKLALSCDLRSLALFRVALASLIIFDLVSRARDLKSHYSDVGVLPRADFLAITGGWRPSLHLVSGSATLQGLLFSLAGIIALALFVGYRTRLMTFLSWIMLMSLQARMPILQQGGDDLLLALLFWGLFLPLGARFSVDAALDDDVQQAPNQYFSAATAALLIQAMSVYFFSALLKSSPRWMPEGTAVESALRIEHIGTPIGAWLRQFEPLTHGLTYFVWCLELLGPFLILLPFFFPWLRLLLQFLFISMHVGFFFCLRIGLFPFVSITSLLSFTPGWVWDKLGEKLRTSERLGLKIYYDKDCGFCLKTCRLLRTFLLFPEIPIRPAQDFPDIYPTMQAHNSWVVVDHQGTQHVKWPALVLLLKRSAIFWPLSMLFGAGFLRSPGDRFYRWVAANRGRLGKFTAVWLPHRSHPIDLALPAQIVVVGIALSVLWSNLSGLPGFSYPLPNVLRNVRDTLSLNQKWNMFAPAPSVVDGWFVVRGETRDGTVVDVLKNYPTDPDFSRPENMAAEYPNYRWRKYLTRLALEVDKAHRPPFARYLCRTWDQRKPDSQRLASVKIYFNMERIELNDDPRPVTRLLLHEQACATPSNSPKESVPPRQTRDENPL